ncbi:MAG: septation protein IspZ [Candidatus Pacebacteria bacterium]|nr:septation protein IspZ [Candidatus Paceibacterota bacterium]
MLKQYKAVAVAWSIEFGPIILFFIALSFLGSDDAAFLISTAIFTIATAVALATSYILEKRIAWFPLIAGGSVLLFGIITLAFKNPELFMVKDTFYNGFFAVFLLGGAFFDKAMLKPLFIGLFDIQEKGWFILSVRWGLFFLLLTILNEIVWRNYSNDVWVSYKFWSTVLTAVFGFYQLTLSKRFRNKEASPLGLRTSLYRKES